jgi:signal peptidase II
VIWVVFIAAAITLLDQLTKWLVLRFVGAEESRVVINGFFNLVNWRNSGAAWGMFQDYNFILAIISLVTIFVLYFLRHTLQLHRASSRIALGLICGGIVGNLIDRVRHGHVVDFLDFYVGRHHWPAFNVADSAICAGVALYILLSWMSEREAQAAKSTP